MTADESVWERYCYAHPDASQLKNKGLSCYSHLQIIFEGRIATDGLFEFNGHELKCVFPS